MTDKAWRFGKEELRYVKEVLESGLGASTEGTMNQRLERAFADRFGVRYGITHNSGTSTLHACLAAAGVGPGDEVISPALTVISNAFVTLHQNAVPVFADIDPETFNMDPEDVRRKITPRTKAIMPVHLYGLPCDMAPIIALAEEHDLVVIEDAAQCFLGKYHGRLAGTIGHLASFSFENTKHMSTGDGGIVKIPVSPVYRVVTSDADNDSVTVSVTGQPRNGVVAPLGNGTWAYTSTSNGAPDSFTLTATDGHGGSTSATRVV